MPKKKKVSAQPETNLPTLNATQAPIVPKRDLSRFENLQYVNSKTATARCPVCTARGNDYAGDHLRICLSTGSYVCLNYRGKSDENLHKQALHWHFAHSKTQRVVWTEENIPFWKLSKRPPRAKNAKPSQPSKSARRRAAKNKRKKRR